jgi:hypothetical protein
MNWSPRLVALTALLSAYAPFALAQDAELPGILTDGVRCLGVNAKDDLGLNVRKLEATPEAITAALNQVAADETRCAPVREAAAELAASYILASTPSEEELAERFAKAIVAQTLAEADSKAATMKFDVGPPPRNMTSGRADGP